ncbi:3961_t:CDS:2 [Ambispora gerdemannii]|uniref:3961_t:CDS:1 n=1 Tax=Ambispora gerdemannii TaxID=144530 RepID=A0A9N8ZXP7_9GLOM|nr:3961_t:CDS:2 [Ambispora gerdemannii]
MSTIDDTQPELELIQQERESSPTLSAKAKGKGRAIDVEEEEESNGQNISASLPTPPPEITVNTTENTASNSPEQLSPREERGATITNETSQVATEYHLKAIEWFDITTGKTKQLKVITQNGNVLILRGDIEIRPYDRPSITYELLVEILGDYLLNSIAKGEAEPSVYDYHHTLNTALSIIPSLQTGLDVNVKFNSIFGFEPTAELSVFDVFNVDLVHGWVVDPQDYNTWDVVVEKCGSYNRAVECVVQGDATSKGLVVESLDNGAGVGNSTNANRDGVFNADERDALIASQFLISTATQLTYHGLQTLVEDLRPGHLCVLFRNNHFSTLYKHSETSSLYVLVTDAGFINERSVVWETLTDVDQSNAEFLTAQFRKGKVVGDYVDLVEEQQQHEVTGGGDQDYALALSLQQQEEEREAQYLRQQNNENLMIQKRKEQEQIRYQQQPQKKGHRTYSGGQQQQQNHNTPSDNISHSSTGSWLWARKFTR